MYSYNIELKRTVFKILEDIRKSRPGYFRKIVEIINLLKYNPVPYQYVDVKKIKGYMNTYRIRVGNIRILYRIDRKSRSIIIFDIGYRGKIY